MTSKHFPSHRRLTPEFFRRPTLKVARELVGMLLIHDSPAGRTSGIIVETEGYTGADDPGSHAARGLKRRNAPMFGPPGRAYVYKCHMYPLLNVVTERAGAPGAVLLRALEPVEGIELMHHRRPGNGVRSLTNGPGKLCQAMGVGLRDNQASLLQGPLYLARPSRKPRARVLRSTRIGLKGEAAKLRRRFFSAGNPFVSPHPREAGA